MVVSASRTTNIAGSCGDGEAGALVGIAAASAAATSKFTIHHPPEANGADWNDA
jgi:hypothetical protein